MTNENRKNLGDAVEIVDILDALFRFQNAGKGTIFCGFFGHVSKLSVRVHAPVWVSGRAPAFDKAVYLDEGPEYIRLFKDELFKFLNSF